MAGCVQCLNFATEYPPRSLKLSRIQKALVAFPTTLCTCGLSFVDRPRHYLDAYIRGGFGASSPHAFGSWRRLGQYKQKYRTDRIKKSAIMQPITLPSVSFNDQFHFPRDWPCVDLHGPHFCIESYEPCSIQSLLCGSSCLDVGAEIFRLHYLSVSCEWMEPLFGLQMYWCQMGRES